MKIAIPTRGDIVDGHFGHCEYYTIITVDENKKITASESIQSASGCGCKSGIATLLRSKGVTIMLAGNIGAGAINVLEQNGIAVYRGCSGKATEVALAFIEGLITDSGVTCQAHEHGHEHGHGCNH